MFHVNHDAKGGLQCATLIGITLQRFTLYTLASPSSVNTPKMSYLCICASLKPKLLSTYVGGDITTYLDFMVLI